MTKPQALLEINDLVTAFDTPRGILRAADRVSFKIQKSEILGIVGESGCGKSVTALSILRLLPHRIAKLLQGEIIFKGKNILEMDDHEIREVRGNEIAMIFQDPMTSLNPVFRVGDQIEEAILLHQDIDQSKAREMVWDVLTRVGIPNAKERANDYPHQFSGGQRQRVMIAMALSCKPALLIADEPTTALDVTIQAQILDLIKKLKNDFDMSVLMISHDLGVISEMADKVMIMYAGQVVELGPVAEVLQNPLHPYTKGLLHSTPKFSFERGQEQIDELPVITGQVPDLFDLPSGCRFANRCPFVKDHCHIDEPPIEVNQQGHEVRCWEWRSLS